MTNEVLTDQVLDDFQRLTSYDVRAYLEDYLTFNDLYYANLVNYYTGVSNVLPTTSFAALKTLVSETKTLNDVIMLNAPTLSQYRFWVLTEYLDSISHSLQTAQNLSKWARSAVTSTGYKKQVITDYILSQNQTLQSLDQQVLGDNDPDGWVDLALQNGLAEDDYTLAGGALIKVAFQNNTSLVLTSVVGQCRHSG